jgi:hypothetical protein
MSCRARVLAALLTLALAGPALARQGPRPGATKACEKMERRLARLDGRARTIERLARRYAERCVRLNQIQVLGTHNSYHVQPRPALFSALLLFDPTFAAWEYTHAPLDEQFATQGIRQIELDVFHDPDGGLYADRPVLGLIGDPTLGAPTLLEPGLKVLHVQDVDFESTCLTFVDCLTAIRDWSDANRHHLPIMVLVEVKDDPIPDPLDLGFIVPLAFDAEAFDAIDTEIRQVFRERRLITPDDVRRGRDRLEDAVLEDGWPTLRRARGRVLFALDNGGAAGDLYRAGRPSLEGRVLFTNATPGDADAAFVKRNDPIGGATDIPALVAQGYLVRTRADADTAEARTGDTTQRDAAIASGAHFVSTDYPVENPDFGTGYRVEIPNGSPARCNPINAPAGCRADALEHLRRR